MKKGKVLPPVYFFSYLILAVILHYILPVLYIIPKPFGYSGILLIVIGVLIVSWSALLFAKKETAIKPFKESTTLITEGPFRFTRNPMYLSMALAHLGVAFLLGSVITFLAPIAMFITVNKLFIPTEEKMLEKTFGEHYLNYKNHVRRWL